MDGPDRSRLPITEPWFWRTLAWRQRIEPIRADPAGLPYGGGTTGCWSASRPLPPRARPWWSGPTTAAPDRPPPAARTDPRRGHPLGSSPGAETRRGCHHEAFLLGYVRSSVRETVHKLPLPHVSHAPRAACCAHQQRIVTQLVCAQEGPG